MKCIVVFIIICSLITQVGAANYSQTLRPNATGDLENLTSSSAGDNYLMVDEVSSDGDTTYVFSTGTSFVRDLYNIEDHVGSGVINDVTVFTRSREVQSSGTGFQQTVLKSGTTTVTSGSTTLTTSYVNKTQTYTTNPDTGNPWAWVEIDALQVGVNLSKQTGYGQARSTQVWIVVDYEYIPRIERR